MKFSIIIPCYNLARWIEQCLDSVIAQDFNDWECIVIDDESTDGSGLILDGYARRDSRFKIIHQKNAGEGGARNAGLGVATGDWVFFLDGDDLMLPNTLSLLADCISESDNVIRFDFCEFNDGEQPEINDKVIQTKAQRVDIAHEIRMSEFYTYVWQHIYKRSVIDGMRFKKYKRGCDRVFLGEVLLNRTDAVKVVDLVCYGYRKRAGSAMNSVPSRQVLCDEMDHRLDIMEMIDASGKKVSYKGDAWLEKYFITQFYHIVTSRDANRSEIINDWKRRLKRLRHIKGISAYCKFVTLVRSTIGVKGWNTLVCYIIPELFNGKSPLRYFKRKMKISRI